MLRFQVLCWLLIGFELLSGQPSLDSRSRRTVEALLMYDRMDDSGAFNYYKLHELLLRAHPSDVTLKDIELRVLWEEKLLAKRHLIDGVVFPLRVDAEGDGESYRLCGGGDSALYTGTYLCGLVFRYLATGNEKTLEQIAATLDGIYKLTHITGKPGMLARFACPLKRAKKDGFVDGPNHHRIDWLHIYYSDPAHVDNTYRYMNNLVAGVNTAKISVSPAAQTLNGSKYYGDTYYYTRTTRDQMTGVVLGLSTVVYFFEHQNIVKYLPHYRLQARERDLIKAIRDTAHNTASDIFRYLHENDWELKDHLCNKAGTWANGISGLLKLAVQMLFRRTLMNTFPMRKLGASPEQLRAWRENFELLKSYDQQLLPGGICDTGNFTNLFASAAWWDITTDYYAWNLRSDRVFSIVLLDDMHPEFCRAAPKDWPTDTISETRVNSRNRMWMRFWNRKLWANVYADSNPWFTLLYNYSRKILLERHYRQLPSIAGRSIYSVSDREFTRLFKYRDKKKHDRLFKVLFATDITGNYDYTSRKRTLGIGLSRVHFHMKSLAITPIRSYSPACRSLKQSQWKRCKSKTRRRVYPPHLKEMAIYWIFAKNPAKAADPNDPLDKIGGEERSLISLPTTYWLARFSGQFDYQFDTYKRKWFVPQK